MENVVAIVDPFSSGSLIAQKFINKGIKCISVLSEFPIPELFLPSYKPGDFIEELDASADLTKVISTLEQYNVIAVIPGLESGVILADKISALAGIVGNNTKTSKNRRHKYFMIEAIKEYGLKTASQCLCSSVDEAIEGAKNINEFPLIVKPVDSGGSNNVYLCSSIDEVQSGALNILNTPNVFGKPSNEILIQTFLKGEEYVVDCVSYDGKHVTTNVFKYEKISANGSQVVYRSIIPVDLDSSLAKTLIAYNDSVLDALEVSYGASHSEVIITSSGPAIVEVGARLHGGGIPGIIDTYSNVSQLSLLVDSYSDPEVFMGATYDIISDKKIHIHHCVSYVEGNINNLNLAREIESLSSFEKLVWYVKKSGKIRLTKDLDSCPAKVVLAHEDAAVIKRDIQTLVELENHFHTLCEA